MSTDDYIVQNIYRYSRKSYKKDGNSSVDAYTVTRRTDIPDDGPGGISPGCSCELDSEGIMASILHKKCPVIALAQQQLQRVVDETDRIFCDKRRCCRSTYDFLLLCKDITCCDSKYLYALLLVLVCFIMGIILGAASCGTHLRKFDSPVLACIDSLFAYDVGDETHPYHAIF